MELPGQVLGPAMTRFNDYVGTRERAAGCPEGVVGLRYRPCQRSRALLSASSAVLGPVVRVDPRIQRVEHGQPRTVDRRVEHTVALSNSK